MSRDDFEALPSQGGDGLGCEPFGHLASPFVDGELPDNESELLLRRLSQDAALRQQVAEYLEIGRLVARNADGTVLGWGALSPVGGN